MSVEYENGVLTIKNLTINLRSNDYQQALFHAVCMKSLEFTKDATTKKRSLINNVPTYLHGKLACSWNEHIYINNHSTKSDCLLACKYDKEYAIKKIPTQYIESKEFLLKAVKLNPEIICYVGIAHTIDKEIAIATVSVPYYGCSGQNGGWLIKRMPQFLDDYEVVYAALNCEYKQSSSTISGSSKYGYTYQYISSRLKKNPILALMGIKICFDAIYDIDAELFRNPDFLWDLINSEIGIYDLDISHHVNLILKSRVLATINLPISLCKTIIMYMWMLKVNSEC